MDFGELLPNNMMGSRDSWARLAVVFKNCCLKSCKNCGLKSVVEQCVFSVNKTKKMCLVS